METLLGIAMIYAWVHGTIIGFKKIENTTQYENAVLIIGLVGFALTIMSVVTN